MKYAIGIVMVIIGLAVVLIGKAIYTSADYMDDSFRWGGYHDK